MIDLVAKFDKHAQAIMTNINERVTDYFKSNTYLILKSRYERLRDSNNMRYSNVRSNNFIGKFVVPLVKAAALQRRALIKRSFAGDPFFSYSPIGNTPEENSVNMQEVVAQNLRTIDFRAQVFSKSAKMAAQYGTDIGFLEFVSRDKFGQKTVQNPDTGEFVVEKDVLLRRERNVQVNRIHFLNYVTDKKVLRHWESGIQAHFERVEFWELQARVNTNPDFYIKNTVDKVLKNARKKGAMDRRFYDSDFKTQNTTNGMVIDILRGYVILPIPGNEDSDQRYYFEMVQDQIIAFKHSFHDQDIVPYFMPMLDPHEDYFWGNTDAEFVQQYENISNALINASVSSTLRSMQQLKLYRKGHTDIAAIQEAIRTNAWVGIEGNVPSGQLKDVIYEHQNNRQDQSSIDYLMREVKEGAARVSSKPDLLRDPNQGGIRNDTATAASISANEGDIMDADYLESYSNGWRKCGRDMAIMLQQNLPERFNIRPKGNVPEQELNKADIQGMMDAVIKTSLQKNKVLEMTRKLNFITQMINLINAAPQQLQGMNIAKLTRDVIRDADVGDVDEVLPEAQAADAAQPGLPPELPPGAPQEQPQQTEGPVQEVGGF